MRRRNRFGLSTFEFSLQELQESYQSIVDRLASIPEGPIALKIYNDNEVILDDIYDSTTTLRKRLDTWNKEKVVDGEKLAHESLVGNIKLDIIIEKRAEPRSTFKKRKIEPQEITKPKLRKLGDISIEIDMYRIFLENYGFIRHYNDPKVDYQKIIELWGLDVKNNFKHQWYFLLKQAKWVICFYSMFYLDFLHDFIYDTSRTIELSQGGRKELNKGMYIKLIENIRDLVKKLYGYYTLSIQSIPPNKDKLIIKNAGTFSIPSIPTEDIDYYKTKETQSGGKITSLDWVFIDIFEFGGREDDLGKLTGKPGYKRPGQKETIIYNNGVVSNCESDILTTLFQDLLNLKDIDKKEAPTSGLNNQVFIQVSHERLLAIMGVHKLDLKNLQKTLFNTPTFSPFEMILNKYITFCNRHKPTPGVPETSIKDLNEFEKIYNSEYDFLITVDSIIKAEKWTNITKQVQDAIDVNKDVTYIASQIDIIDGASTQNSIRKNITEQKESKSNITERVSNTNITCNIFFYFSDGKEQIGQIDIMNFSILSDNFVIRKYFNIVTTSEIRSKDKLEKYPKLTLLSPQNITKNFTKIIQSDIQSKIQLCSFKAILDFAKIIYFWNIINMSIRPDLHNLMVFSDIIAADKGALFIKGSCVEEGEDTNPKLHERPYRFFLRSYQLKQIWDNPGLTSFLTSIGSNTYKSQSGLRPAGFEYYLSNTGGFGKQGNDVVTIIYRILFKRLPKNKTEIKRFVKYASKFTGKYSQPKFAKYLTKFKKD